MSNPLEPVSVTITDHDGISRPATDEEKAHFAEVGFCQVITQPRLIKRPRRARKRYKVLEDYQPWHKPITCECCLKDIVLMRKRFDCPYCGWTHGPLGKPVTTVCRLALTITQYHRLKDDKKWADAESRSP